MREVIRIVRMAVTMISKVGAGNITVFYLVRVGITMLCHVISMRVAMGIRFVNVSIRMDIAVMMKILETLLRDVLMKVIMRAIGVFRSIIGVVVEVVTRRVTVEVLVSRSVGVRVTMYHCLQASSAEP